MGKQLGIINVRGKTGDMGYVKTEDGYFVRRSTSITKDRLANDDAFIRTRLNNDEFRIATKAGKLLRRAVANRLRNAADSKLASRLVQLMMKIRMTDESSDVGLRAAHRGELNFLNEFEFNRHASLPAVFGPAFSTTVDRVTGAVVITVPDFNPSQQVSVPKGASHFMLVATAAELDFENEKQSNSEEDSDFIPTINDSVPGFAINLSLPAASTQPIIAVLGIRFYTKTNGKYYKHNADETNATAIVKIDLP